MWIAFAITSALIPIIDRGTNDNRFCLLDRSIVTILDPGYTKLSALERIALQTDITSITDQAPCTITYIPLVKGT
jgi:hypothetical protein